jgi:hypothetical protein
MLQAGGSAESPGAHEAHCPERSAGIQPGIATPWESAIVEITKSKMLFLSMVAVPLGSTRR